MLVKEVIAAHPECWNKFKDGEDLTIYNSPLFKALYRHWLDDGEMPIGVAKARTGDPDVWIADKLEEYLYATS